MHAKTAHLRALLLWIPIIVLALMAAYVAMPATPALAYDEVNGGFGECHYPCHHQQVGTSKGPHGDFVAATRKCEMCHTVHDAASSTKLLPANTIMDSCMTCHDGTAGKGVYGAIVARGLSVGSEHSIDTTNVVPGGDRLTGGSVVTSFSGEAGRLTCSDCHSPHANDLVAPFMRERGRTTANPVYFKPSTSLLKALPTGAVTSVDEYGSDWCLACHGGRGSTGPVHNHPVETTATADYFHYEKVSRVTTWGVSSTETGTLGFSNFGYVMPSPRTAEQTGHDPICQQCHEDPRSIGDVVQGQVDITELWKVDGLDGADPTDNPRFLNFPHESTAVNLLVETSDDLCLNCHPTTGLP